MSIANPETGSVYDLFRPQIEEEDRARAARRAEWKRFREAMAYAWSPITWLRSIRTFFRDLEIKTRPQ